MPIDPSQVQWDSVDPSAVQWDDEKKQRHTVMSVLDRFKMGMIDPIQGGAQLLQWFLRHYKTFLIWAADICAAELYQPVGIS